MKKEFTISVACHIIFIALFALSGFIKPKMEPPRKIYRVKILASPQHVEAKESKKVTEVEPKPKVETEAKKVLYKKKKKPEEKPEAKKQVNKGDSQVSVDQPDFNDDFYIKLIVNKVSNNWQNPLRAGGIAYKTLIYFKILREGNIEDAKIENRSGNSMFDQAALRAVILSEPFPKLPSDYKGDHLGVHFEFEHIP
ncbi:TonB family protein [bacterium]|nr:TonB family protein [bacterium]